MRRWRGDHGWFVTKQARMVRSAYTHRGWYDALPRTHEGMEREHDWQEGREWRVAPGSRVAASLNVSPEQWPHSGRGSGTTGGLAHRMEPRSGGSADTSQLVKQIAFVEIHAETFQNMNKLILETNLLMVFGLIPDITLDSFYMRMRIGKRAVTALPGFSSIQTHYVLEPPLCGSTRG